MLILTEIDKRLARIKRHKRVRKNISGRSERPRLCIFRSLKHIYAQVIDDNKGITLASLSTLNPEIKGKEKYQGNIKAADMLGSLLAKKLEEKGIKKPTKGLSPGRFFYYFINCSAIWTAFNAAPFRRLSETTHITRPFSVEISSLILPTKTSSFPSANKGRGYSNFSGLSITLIPGKALNISRVL